MTHPLLRSQLEKLRLDPGEPPDHDAWKAMLALVEGAYVRGDNDDKLRTIIASLAEGLVVVDQAGLITSINPEGSRMLGRLQSEALGRPVLELLGFGVLGPSERDAAYEMLAAVLEGCQVQSADDARFVHEDGSIVEVSFQMSPIVEAGTCTGAALVFRDISEAKSIERQLRRNESAVRGLYSLSTAAGDLSGRIVELLSMGCRRFGTETGLLCRIEDDRIEVVEVVTGAGGPVRGTTWALEDTFDRTVLSAAAPLALHDAAASSWSEHTSQVGAGVRAYLGARVVVNGEVFGTLSFTSDEPLGAPFVPADRDVLRLMAEWVGNEISREQARTELEHARDEAEAASRAKSTFLANMSHEIRTPLNGVIGMLELLLDEALDADARECATTARDASSALLSVINDVLDVSKIEAGKIEIERIPFDPHRLLGDIARIMEVQAATKGLDLVLDCEAVEGMRLLGDPSRLRQVLNNFCANALKFTDTGCLEVRARVVGGAPVADGVRVRFEVADSGIGIAPERIGQLFEEFTQADASTTRRFGGTGLGLAISRQLVELMGGEVGADSRVGAGSTFWAEVPFALAAPGETPTPGRVPVRAVLCGDDAATLAMCHRVLRRGNVLVERAHSLTAAEELLGPGGADALLVAVMDAEVADAARALAGRIRGRGHDARLVLVGPPAGYRGDSAAARNAGFDAYLTGATEDLLACVVGPLPGGVFFTRHVIEESLAGAPDKLAAPPTTASDVAGIRILVAEDNPVNRRVAEGMLDRLGCETVLVPDGAAAVDAVGSGAFDLVFMDCHMPVMDGFEAARALRAGVAKRGLPIVALTASATTDVRVQCLDAGMDGVLTKPYTAEQLLTCLREWTARPEGRACADSVAPREDF